MILVDISQVIIANLMQQIGGAKSTVKLEEDLIRHMVLNSLRSYSRKFKKDYGNLVICCDSRQYWRKEVFPFYKANRKKDRGNSTLDWNLIFTTINMVREELKQFFPYKVVEVERAEADDIIATLTKIYSPHEKVLILSSDKDFAQLQKYRDVRQYSPILAKYIDTVNPNAFIKEHILRGDRSDGIPNFMSPDDTFVTGSRQKVINSKKLAQWMDSPVDVICTNETMLRGYKRNQVLVDLDFIPTEVVDAIVAAYDAAKPGNRQRMLNYFIEKRLKNLIEVIDQF